MFFRFAQRCERFEILDSTDKNRERHQIDESNFFHYSFLWFLFFWLWFHGHKNWRIDMWTCFSAAWFVKIQITWSLDIWFGYIFLWRMKFWFLGVLLSWFFSLWLLNFRVCYKRDPKDILLTDCSYQELRIQRCYSVRTIDHEISRTRVCSYFARASISDFFELKEKNSPTLDRDETHIHHSLPSQLFLPSSKSKLPPQLWTSELAASSSSRFLALAFVNRRRLLFLCSCLCESVMLRNCAHMYTPNLCIVDIPSSS